MRYSLRTLVILMLLAGPFCAWCWTKYSAYVEWKAREAAKAELDNLTWRVAIIRAQQVTALTSAPVPVPPEWSESPDVQPREEPPSRPQTLEEARKQLQDSMASAPRPYREGPDHATGTFPKTRVGERIRIGK
jgi:hypothetical protein